MSSFSIRPVGFPERDYVWLEAILTIAGGRLHDNWRWTAEGLADVYLVSVESVSEWDRYLAELAPDRLIACAIPDLDIDARWRIDRDRGKLPALRDITQVLNAVGFDLGSSSFTADARGEAPSRLRATAVPQPGTPLAPVKPEEIAVEASSSTSFLQGVSVPAGLKQPDADAPCAIFTEALIDETYDPEQYLMGIVRECLADRVPRRLSCSDGGGTLLIDPERNQCLISGGKLALLPILSALRDGIEVTLLRHPELTQEAVAAHAHALAIDDALFLSVLLGSRGRIWAGCRFDEPVKLKQWPGFGHLPNSVEYLKLAAFMSGNNADVRTIAERTGIPEDLVINFHNACMAVGLLERGGEVAVRDKSINQNVRDLYEKIAKRLQGEA